MNELDIHICCPVVTHEKKVLMFCSIFIASDYMPWKFRININRIRYHHLTRRTSEQFIRAYLYEVDPLEDHGPVPLRVPRVQVEDSEAVPPCTSKLGSTISYLLRLTFDDMPFSNARFALGLTRGKFGEFSTRNRCPPTDHIITFHESKW